MSPVLRAAMRPIFVLLWAYLGLHVLFALLQTGRAFHPGHWLGALAACLLWIAAVHITRATVAWVNWAALLTVPLSVAVVIRSLDAAGLATYANWWPGPCAVLACLFIVYGRTGMAPLTVAAGAVTCLWLCRVDFPHPATAHAYALSALAAPVAWPLGFAGVLALASRFSDRQLRLESRVVRQSEEVISGKLAMARRDEDVSVMRSISDELLHEIAGRAPGAPISEDERERWRLGALTLRDELGSRAFLDAQLRAEVARARGRGVVVDLQDGYPEGPEMGECTRAFVAEAVRGLQRGDRLSVRRQAGRNVLTVVCLGPGAARWVGSLPDPVEGMRVMSEFELAHLSCEGDLLETWCRDARAVRGGGGRPPARGSGPLGDLLPE